MTIHSSSQGEPSPSLPAGEAVTAHVSNSEKWRQWVQQATQSVGCAAEPADGRLTHEGKGGRESNSKPVSRDHRPPREASPHHKKQNSVGQHKEQIVGDPQHPRPRTKKPMQTEPWTPVHHPGQRAPATRTMEHEPSTARVQDSQIVLANQPTHAPRDSRRQASMPYWRRRLHTLGELPRSTVHNARHPERIPRGAYRVTLCNYFTFSDRA